MSYSQEVYDAVRSKVHWPDVESVLRNAFDISWPLDAVKTEFLNAAYELQRPCVVFKPRLFPDGNMWCALLGDDLQEGVAGFGETPSAAMYDFDKNWREQKLPTPAKQCATCGDHHVGEIPLSCQTGDGV